MNHKSTLSIKEKEARISFLQKQRDGVIIGEYRGILANIYDKIQKICCINLTCRIEQLQELCEATSTHSKNVLIDYCMDLEQLGYICIGEDGRITRTHDRDF